MPDPVRVVHMVAKTHLDLGFTALASEVVERYVADFFPRALAVAAELQTRGRAERFTWTTGSWVLHHALGAGTAEQRNAVAEGVHSGALAWHALPVTTHTELMDAQLVRSALGISAELDARFGRTTTAAKMTDVPGHTRGLVPLLAEAGVTFLHVGVNPAWPMPDVPAVFRWQVPDGTSVVVAYQSGGYGGEVHIPGCGELLAFLHAGDNLGPPTADEVVAAHADLAARYPGAEVRASTLDAFARAVVASGATARLPVVTAEIGDPWVFGAASDPMKVAAYRDLLDRRRRMAEEMSPADRTAVDRTAVDRTLLLVAEHTWGLDQKEALSDVEHWDRSALAALRATPEAKRFELSWAEQRSYVDLAAARFEESQPTGGDRSGTRSGAQAGPVATVAGLQRDIALGPGGTPVGDWSPLPLGEVVDGGIWQLGLSSSGAVDHLVHRASGRVIADVGSGPLPATGLGLVTYQSFDEADYERFYAGLTPTPDDEWWARWDNTKPGIDAAGATSGTWTPEPLGAWHTTHQGGAGHDVLVRSVFRGVPAERLGAPPEVWARWSWSAQASPEANTPDDLDVTVWWTGKPANRLPEATWCSFVPVVAEPERWTLDKLGQTVSPLDVVRRGGRSLHAVGDGMAYDGPDGALRVKTFDAPLVAPGRPNLLDADPPLPDLAGGFHVLLHDNCWGTNFPMWSEGQARFRFTISV